MFNWDDRRLRQTLDLGAHPAPGRPARRAKACWPRLARALAQRTRPLTPLAPAAHPTPPRAHRPRRRHSAGSALCPRARRQLGLCGAAAHAHVGRLGARRARPEPLAVAVSPASLLTSPPTPLPPPPGPGAGLRAVIKHHAPRHPGGRHASRRRRRAPAVAQGVARAPPPPRAYRCVRRRPTLHAAAAALQAPPEPRSLPRPPRRRSRAGRSPSCRRW